MAAITRTTDDVFTSVTASNEAPTQGLIEQGDRSPLRRAPAAATYQVTTQQILQRPLVTRRCQMQETVAVCDTL